MPHWMASCQLDAKTYSKCQVITDSVATLGSSSDGDELAGSAKRRNEGFIGQQKLNKQGSTPAQSLTLKKNMIEQIQRVAPFRLYLVLTTCKHRQIESERRLKLIGDTRNREVTKVW